MKPPIFDSNWNSEVNLLHEHDLREIWDRSIAPHIWNQYHNQLQIYLKIASKKPNSRVLDLGCAQATLALLLAESGHRVTAVDLRNEFLEYAKSRYESGDIEFVQGNALEFSSGVQFDLVFANQIIEHTIYPEQLMAVARDALKPGGTMIVTTPNHAYLKNKLPSFSELTDRDELAHKQFTADGDGHFFAYTKTELTNICLETGFISPEVKFFESPFISGHMKIRHLHGFTSPNVWRILDGATLSIPVVKEAMAHQLLLAAMKP